MAKKKATKKKPRAVRRKPASRTAPPPRPAEAATESAVEDAAIAREREDMREAKLRKMLAPTVDGLLRDRLIALNKAGFFDGGSDRGVAGLAGAEIKPASPLAAHIADAQRAVEVLADTVGRLESALTPVLAEQQNIPAPPGTATSPAPIECRYSTDVNGITGRADAIRAHVNALIGRLQV